MPDTGLSHEASNSIRQRTESEVASCLLAYLRSMLENASLNYAEPPVRITGGFDTRIYGFRLLGASQELSSSLILRVFPEENPLLTLTPAERARFESAVQNTVAGLGYPAPRVLFDSTEPQGLGGPFLIMERMPGRIMLDLFFRPSPLFFRLTRILAQAHARLHALDPQRLLGAIEAEGIPARTVTVEDWLERMGFLIDRAFLDGLRPGLTWLLDNRPLESERPVICHGDFHPLNLLVIRGEVSGVIDWGWLRIADPEYDVGATIALFTQGPVELPTFLGGIVNWSRRRLIENYYRAYRRLRPLNADAVRYYEAMRCLGFLVEAGQHRQADYGLIERPQKPTAFSGPHVIRSITSRLSAVTGLTLTLPPPIPAIKRAARKE